MHYRVFYLFERSGEAVSSVNAIEMTARTICEQLLPRLQSEDDYLGLIDAQDNVLQIFRAGATEYWLELPIEAAKASYSCRLEFAPLQALLLKLPAVFQREDIPDLEYRPW
ncbi:hypothetical protein CKO12_04555 [Chromatium okenii]|uniref:hypothetical protein n=1 Tax=Chromatium okenii TaxID=61644 RepID=UPI001905F997|nr:hypothetical protein [Chromatium okenii]MBK1641155.1 hypothetical protein [Chromatium okenii]